MSEHICRVLPQPQPERDPGALPGALTFFVSRAERARVLRALRRLSDDRGRALVLAAEAIEQGGGGDHG